MRHAKTLLFISGLSAVLVTAGCASWQSDKGGRTAGRVVDDNQINEQVESNLSREPVYKFSDVDVKTFNGVVQLSGFVASEDQKRKAGELAQKVDGVAQVVNSIALIPQNLTPTGRTNTITYPDQPLHNDTTITDDTRSITR